MEAATNSREGEGAPRTTHVTTSREGEGAPRTTHVEARVSTDRHEAPPREWHSGEIGTVGRSGRSMG